jgi:hypothetical protein
MTGNPHAAVTYPWPVGQKWEHVDIVHGRFAGDCPCITCDGLVHIAKAEGGAK